MSEQPYEFGRVFGQGRFKTVDVLGKGGVGVVYSAEDLRVRTRVALKVPHKHFQRSRGVRARFKNEGRFLGMLRHPGIPLIYDLGIGDDETYLAIELIEGASVEDCLRDGSIPPRAAVKIMRDLAIVLDAVHNHERRIIHRDLKPDNIRLRYDGSLVLTDFGLAKSLAAGTGSGVTLIGNLTRNAKGLGTAGYMSEAQYLGIDLDERTDLFSVGVTLWVMLTNPIRDMATAAKWKKWDTKSPNDPMFEGVPEVLRPVIIRCFQGVFMSAKELLAALDETAARLEPDTSDRFWERLSQRPTAPNLTIVPKVDSLDDEELVSQDAVPPSNLNIGDEELGDDDDDEDDEDDDESEVAEVTRTDPTIRRKRRNRRWMRQGITILAAGIALIAVTYAATIKSDLRAAPSSSDALPPAINTAIIAVGAPSGAPVTDQPVDLLVASSKPAKSPATNGGSRATGTTKRAASVTRPAPATMPVASTSPDPAAPTRGTVKLIGKPVAARLVSEAGGGTYGIPSDVPPGTYRVEAKFAGKNDFDSFHTVEVKIGETTRVRCDADVGTCTK